MNPLVTKTFKDTETLGGGQQGTGDTEQIWVKTTNKYWQGDERKMGITGFGGEVF